MYAPTRVDRRNGRGKRKERKEVNRRTVERCGYRFYFCSENCARGCIERERVLGVQVILWSICPRRKQARRH